MGKKLVKKSKRDAEPEAQFQSCVGSQCNQNNLFGKRKREIAEAVDRLATDILNEEAKQVAKREAEAQIQNCAGSQCNQNNLGLGALNLNPFNFGVGAQQNCVGSQCNQNNLFGRRKREIADAVNQLAEDMIVEEINHAVLQEAEGQRKRREIVASILEGF